MGRYMMGRRERPIDPTSGPLEAFAFDLRLLRTKAGEPSYRKLAQRAGVSASALSAAAGGVVLPSRRVTLAYVCACGADINEWSSRWEALRAQLAEPQAGTPSWDLPSPGQAYGPKAGLAQAVWQQWIHGRLRTSIGDGGLIAPRMTSGGGRPIDLAALAGLLHDNRRIVLVGPPGVGKSVACLCLVRELLATGTGPLPVVVAALALSGSTAEPAVGWWCAEIARRYGTSRALARSWLDSGQLLPVLDGLDALPPADRATGISVINAIPACLVTCRAGVYEMLASKLGPHDVVSLQPLSPSQVQRQLPVELDPELAELLTIPAFLRPVMRMPPCEVTDGHAVCAEFVRTAATGYAPHLTWKWLSWMAQFPVFDPRRPRVDMLPRRAHRRLARGGAIGVVTVCALAIIEGATWLATGWWPEPQSGPAIGLVIGLIAAVVCLAAVKTEARLRRIAVLWLLVLEGALPRDVSRFLHAAHDAGLLDQTREGYRFAHRQLRRYFLGDAQGRTG